MAKHASVIAKGIEGEKRRRIDVGGRATGTDARMKSGGSESHEFR